MSRMRTPISHLGRTIEVAGTSCLSGLPRNCRSCAHFQARAGVSARGKTTQLVPFRLIGGPVDRPEIVVLIFAHRRSGIPAAHTQVAAATLAAPSRAATITDGLFARQCQSLEIHNVGLPFLSLIGCSSAIFAFGRRC